MNVDCGCLSRPFTWQTGHGAVSTPIVGAARYGHVMVEQRTPRVPVAVTGAASVLGVPA